MKKGKFYYTCDTNSRVGRKLRSFWRTACHAAERADDFARKYGAVSYITPDQFFMGGVDYLEFDHKPDLRVWRKRVHSADGIDEYEPNCMCRADVLIIPDDRFQPSDTWNRTYSREHLSWEQARQKKTLKEWATIVGYTLTDDNETDWDYVTSQLHNRFFVPFMEFFGELTEDGKSIPQTLRRAVRAEKDRLALPVVKTETLLLLLGSQIPQQDNNKKAFPVWKRRSSFSMEILGSYGPHSLARPRDCTPPTWQTSTIRSRSLSVTRSENGRVNCPDGPPPHSCSGCCCFSASEHKVLRVRCSDAQ